MHFSNMKFHSRYPAYTFSVLILMYSMNEKKKFSDKDIIKPNTKCALFIRDMPFLLHLLYKPPNT